MASNLQDDFSDWQGSAQNLLRGGKKGQNFLYFCHFSIEKRWLKWLGGGKCRPVPTSVGRTLDWETSLFVSFFFLRESLLHEGSVLTV